MRYLEIDKLVKEAALSEETASDRARYSNRIAPDFEATGITLDRSDMRKILPALPAVELVIW